MQNNQPFPNIYSTTQFQFSVNAIKHTEILEIQRKHIIARQLLKSGTSIGPNVKEVQNAESKADFIHKMKISCKEADEAEYWLMLNNASGSYAAYEQLLIECRSIIQVLSKIVSSSELQRTLQC